MGTYIGLDVGTTTLSAVLLCAEDGRVLSARTRPHTAAIAGPADQAELDLNALYRDAELLLAELHTEWSTTAGQVAGIGVTGQMHGLALVGVGGVPLAPAITWQDHRTLRALPGSTETFLEAFVRVAGGLGSLVRAGAPPAAGYLGPTLYWLARSNALASLARLPGATACTVPDAVVAHLSNRPACTDPTDAASTGLYDITTGDWDLPLVERLGLPPDLLARVRPAGEVHGDLCAASAVATGWPEGTPVCTALGDNQASFVGSVADAESTILLNVGTGAQISGWQSSARGQAGLDLRPFPHGGYLLVGAGLFGGRSYAYLADLFRQVGAGLFGARSDEALYGTMTQLASQVPPGCDGLVCEPFFTGSRADPALRGAYRGLTPKNLTPGHLARALLEGMAESFWQFAQLLPESIARRPWLAGAGNAIRLNPLFAEILAARFGRPLVIPLCEEPAAAGAAWLAAIGLGEVPDLASAMGRTRPARVFHPPTG